MNRNLDQVINKIRIYQILILLILILYITYLNNYIVPLLFDYVLFKIIILLILVFILKFDLLLGLFFGIAIIQSILLANQKKNRYSKEKNWNLISNNNYDNDNLLNNNYVFNYDEEDTPKINRDINLSEKSISKNYSV